MPWYTKWGQAIRNIMRFGSGSATVEELYTWFDAIGCPRSRLPKDEIAEATNLAFLGSQEIAKVQEVPAAIVCLKNLWELRLTDAPLRCLPENIGDLSNLDFLELGNRQYVEENRVYDVRPNTEFRHLPASITRLKKLTRLDIQYTALSELPEDFGKLVNLVYLDLTGNKIEKLPDSMARLKNLETLYLGRNRLTELPAWIQHFEKLEHLVIGGNPLRTVPGWLGEMPSLLSLRCSEDMEAPMLARMRKKLTLPLGKLQAEFLNQVGDLGFELPEESVAARRRGTLSPDGEEEFEIPYGYGRICQYLFGRDEKGEYVDYYIAHKIWGDEHRRIWESGETEHLETFSVMFSPPEEVQEIGGRLEAKGFWPTY
jgi:hypothetical protein